MLKYYGTYLSDILHKIYPIQEYKMKGKLTIMLPGQFLNEEQGKDGVIMIVVNVDECSAEALRLRP